VHFNEFKRGLQVENSGEGKWHCNPSVMITGMADPAGMLPKFYKADR
jgi:hypothetical protein